MQFWNSLGTGRKGEIIVLTGDFNLGTLYSDTIKTLIKNHLLAYTKYINNLVKIPAKFPLEISVL